MTRSSQLTYEYVQSISMDYAQWAERVTSGGPTHTHTHGTSQQIPVDMDDHSWKTFWKNEVEKKDLCGCPLP